MDNFLLRYASRVVIYNRRAVIRLATDRSMQFSFSVTTTQNLFVCLVENVIVYADEISNNFKQRKLVKFC